MTAIGAWLQGLKQRRHFYDAQVRGSFLLGLASALLAFTYYVGARRGFQGPPSPGSEIEEDLLLSALCWGYTGFSTFRRRRKQDGFLPATEWRISSLRLVVSVLLAIAAVAYTGMVPALMRALVRRDSVVVFETLGFVVLVLGIVLAFLTPFYYVRAIAHSEESDRGPGALPPASSLQPPA